VQDRCKSHMAFCFLLGLDAAIMQHRPRMPVVTLQSDGMHEQLTS
jgi:hypothetical protein